MHKRQEYNDGVHSILDRLIRKMKSISIRKRERLKKLYEPVIEQYVNICINNGFDPTKISEFDSQAESRLKEFNFWREIENSLAFVADSDYLFCATQSINSLAQKWDEQQGNQISHTHIFFISPTEESTYTQMFFDIEPPDKRLICIFLRKKKKYSPQDFYEVIHEVGHYIGRRMRKNRKLMFFDSVIAEFCNQLYLRMMNSELCEREIRDIHANIEDNIYMGARLRELSFDTRTCVERLYKSIDPKSNRDVLQWLADADSSALSEVSLCTDWGEEQRARASWAIDQGYFSFLTPIVLYAIDTHSDSVAEKIKSICINSSILQDENQAMRLLMIDGACVELFAEINEHAEVPRWIRTCETLFKEPGADLFMIEMVNMTILQYVLLMLSASYNNWKEEKKLTPNLTFLQFLSNGELYPRIVGVLCSVFGATNKHMFIHESMFKLYIMIRYFNDGERKRAYCAGYDLIRQGVIAFNNARSSKTDTVDRNSLYIFNPIQRVYEYLTTIQKEFWSGTELSTQNEIKKLIKPFMYRMALFPLMKKLCLQNTPAA